jgi:hypothetical protein
MQCSIAIAVRYAHTPAPQPNTRTDQRLGQTARPVHRWSCHLYLQNATPRVAQHSTSTTRPLPHAGIPSCRDIWYVHRHSQSEVCFQDSGVRMHTDARSARDSVKTMRALGHPGTSDDGGLRINQPIGSRQDTPVQTHTVGVRQPSLTRLSRCRTACSGHRPGSSAYR